MPQIMQLDLHKTETVDAIFKELVQMNSEINQMDTQQLIERLNHCGLNTGGNDDLRRRRLKDNYRQNKLASVNFNLPRKLLPYYVVIDFEATCMKVKTPNFQPEIIEFPAVLVNGNTQMIEDTFQMYCKPVINPILSDFCKELTGITQEQVDSGKNFEHVLESFENWLVHHKLGKGHKFAIVTDGSSDMTKFLFQQCQQSNIVLPKWGKKWVNLRRSFRGFYKFKWASLKNMLMYLDMELEGHLHCGLDDAKNIARILIRMICDGASVLPNERISLKANITSKQSKALSQTKTKLGNCVEGKADNVSDLNEKMENLKVRPDLIVFRSIGKMPDYNAIKKQRRQIQAKMLRELKEKCEVLEEAEAFNKIMEWIPPQLTRRRK